MRFRKFSGRALIAAILTIGLSRHSIVHGEENVCDPNTRDTLYTIGYAHLDTQWRWTFQDSIYLYIGNTMVDNFRLFEKYPGYRFNFTGSKRYMMMKEYYPENYERVKEYVRQGRWLVSGSSVDENDANVPSTESLVRNVLYGNLFFKKEFNKVSEDYMLPDCFGFPASMPSVLAHAGMKGFSTQKLSWGSAVGIPFNVGVWEGPDGRSVVAALNPGSYVSRLEGDLSRDAEWLARAREMGRLTGFSADFKYFGTGDVGGAPDEGSADWLQKSLESDGPLCVKSAQSDDLFQDVTKPQIDKMKRYKGDLLLVEHSAGSLSSQAYVKRWNRKSELLADGAERASLIADWLGAVPYPRERIRDVWHLILGGQMHDILPGTSIPKAYEFSWNDAIIAQNVAAGVLESAAGAVAEGLDTDVTGAPLAVYNPLSVAREDIVRARVRFEGGTPAAIRVFSPSGAEVPAQIVSGNGEEMEIVFLASAPPVGFAVYDVRPSREPGRMETGLRATENSLENDRFLVRIDENGDVSSVFDKKAGREALSGPVRLELMEDSPRDWPAWNIDWADWQQPARAAVKGPVKARVKETGPARVSVEIERETEGSTFVQTISLAAGSPGARVEFDAAIDWRTPSTCLKAAFPLSVAARNASYNLGLGVVERESNHSRKFEVPSHQWFDLTAEDGGYGVSILEDSKYGSDKPSDDTVRLTLVRTPGCRSFCDQATQDMGRHRVKYAMAPHVGDWREGDSHWQAMRLNQPLVAFATEKRSGALGGTFSFLSVSDSRVAVRAAKMAEEGDEIIVRLQELSGRPVPGTKVSFAVPVISAREVDGQEREIGPARIENGALIADMEPFVMRAFAVRIGAARAAVSKPESRPLTLDYNLAAATRDGEKSSPGFDKDGAAYSADMLPSELAVDGVEFKLEPGGAEKANAVACDGRDIPLPDGGFDKLYLLASAKGGDAEGVFLAGGREIPLTVQEWKGFVGQWDNRIWKNDREIFGLRPAYTKRDEIAWFASHHHDAGGGNMAYNYTYLFKYEIDLPEGATSVTLPKNDDIRIFAATAVRNPADGAAPAQLLYDDFEKPAAAPRFSPAEGKYDDSVFVNIQAPWYSSYDELRFTTDGSDPTPASPVFKSPILISDRTVIKAGAFRNDGTMGIVQFGQFEVKDVTPPAVEKVEAYNLAPKAIVKFTEPVEKASAEDPANYGLDGGLQVRSAVLDEDDMTAALSLSSIPEEGRDYTLTAKGLKDLSRSGNVLQSPRSFGFRTASPAFGVKFRTRDIAYSLGLPGVSKDFSLHGDLEAVKGPFGLAVRMKGGKDCIVVNDRPALNPTEAITLAAWVRAKDWEGNRRIMQKGNADDQYRLTAEGGELLFDLAGVGQIKGPLPPAGEWRHVAATYDGWRMRLYVDGKIVREQSAAGRISTTGDPLHLGTKNPNAPEGDFFKGDMDKLMVWGQALPADQIAALAAR